MTELVDDTGVVRFEGTIGFTDQLLVATSDPDVTPFRIDLPVGFRAGASFRAIEVYDEDGARVFRVDADGSIFINSDENGGGNIVAVGHPGADFPGRVAFDPAAVTGTLQARTGGTSALTLKNDAGDVQHSFVAGGLDGGSVKLTLPTVAPVAAGQLWNDSGTVKIS